MYLIPSVDGGHGGIYPPGWRHAGQPCTGGSWNGIVESHYVLDLALRTDHVCRSLNIKPFLTRNQDTFLGLGQRADLAQGAGAGFAMSYHCNGHEKHREWRGITLYFMDGDPLAKVAAEAVADHCPPEFRRYRMLFPITMPLSKNDAWLGRPLDVIRPYSERSIRCLLIEFGFMSNRTDARLMKTEEIKGGFVNACVQGIKAAADYTKHMERLTPDEEWSDEEGRTNE